MRFSMRILRHLTARHRPTGFSQAILPMPPHGVPGARAEARPVASAETPFPDMTSPAADPDAPATPPL